MNKLLMHQDNIAAVLTDDLQLKEIVNRNEMPVGATGRENDSFELQKRYFVTWRQRRCIPDGRQGLERITEKIENIDDIFLSSLNVSLTDTFWIKDESMPLLWQDVNFHDNGFKPFLAHLVFFQNDIDVQINNPDWITNGMLEKGWVNIDGVPALIKGGNYGPYGDNDLLCANEVFASRLLDESDILHTRYFPVRVKDRLICGCTCFVKDSKTDFIAAEQIMRAGINTEQLYRWFKEHNMRKDLDYALAATSLIHNIDMHTLNFGILKNEDISFCPMFDLGSSLGYNEISRGTIDIRPFYSDIKKQTKMIKYFPKFISKHKAFEILEETYEEYQISNDRLQVARNTLQDGYQLIEQIKEKNKLCCL